MIQNIINLMMHSVISVAAPIVQSFAASTRNTNATSDVVTMPAGIVAGDMLLYFASKTATTTYTCAGWTEITTRPTNAYWAFYRVATGGEGASQTFASGTSTRFAGICLRIDGTTAVVPDVTGWGTATTETFTGVANFLGTVMTVTTVSTGTLSVGDLISVNANSLVVDTPVYISSFGTGGGGLGTYNLSQTVATLTGVVISGNLPTIDAPSITPNTSSDLLICAYLLGGPRGQDAFPATYDNGIAEIGNAEAAATSVQISGAAKVLSSGAATGLTKMSPVVYSSASKISVLIKP